LLVVGGDAFAPSRVLCIGAHSDDIEIGAGGTLLKLLGARPATAVDWVVLAAHGERAEEARASAARFVKDDAGSTIAIESFRERYFPQEATALKEYFDELGRRTQPEVVICPTRGDAHQDHRTVAELAAATFRDQLILEYEIPKFDGDLGRPNVYVQLEPDHVDAKIDILMHQFPTQLARDWFTEETFRGLMRLRGIEARSPGGYAEAFHCRKLVLA
jgi:LmbE family N-acetylglucosaminyl deacetylase